MKRTIKKTILAAVFVLGISTQGRGQGIPVYDNTNFIAFAKSIIESAKQTSNLLKTVKFLKAQKERIEKVSNVVKQLKSVQQLTSNNEKLFNRVKGDLKDILRSPHIHPDEINRISDAFNDIIETSMEDLNFCQRILSNDELKMTDGERASVLQGMEQRSKEMVIEVEQKTRRYREIISFREMQEKINNRKSEY